LQLVYTKHGQIIDIEGNYESPINGGTLCPKGAATWGLMNSPLRITTVKYRAPYSDHWEDRPLDWAMERIAQRVKATRDSTYEEKNADGVTVNRTTAIGHLGGATLDNEENYLIKKLFTAGLGIVAVENQARI
jgi:formate dehydrogenase major subunit